MEVLMVGGSFNSKDARTVNSGSDETVRLASKSIPKGLLEMRLEFVGGLILHK